MSSSTVTEAGQTKSQKESNIKNDDVTSDMIDTIPINSIVTERIPQSREVASGMKNLGNTCYMNAVLQALAHAPELCHAIDSLPHHSICPIAIRNFKEEQLQKSKKESAGDKDTVDSANTSPLPGSDAPKKKSRKKKVDILAEAELLIGDFCTLCEFEKHIVRVHQSGANNSNDPDSGPNSNTNLNSASSAGDNVQIVAPADFVRGFIKDIAPWFKLGVQEDSHEFLRLLIDAMQNSSQKAKTKLSENTIHSAQRQEDNDNSTEKEYPFYLFQGTVQSSVTCNACKVSNTTLDPFEDIGLEVSPLSPSAHTLPKRNTSPTPSSTSDGSKLADVPAALESFTRMEKLDAQYKCEKCNALGSATKESRLARIPPILTLHLKRFRYGQQASASSLGGGTSGMGSAAGGIGGGYGTNSSYLSGPSYNSYTNTISGASGSSKIEGHVRFDQFFDIRPFLTSELKKKHRAMFCRLFAVIVHSGKNSHSGHYISYVRNLAKNEWWKMDDARIVRVSTEEVMNSEAYMLFYRVVDHPVAAKLKTRAMERIKESRLIEDEKRKKEQMLLLRKMKIEGDDDKEVDPIAKGGKDLVNANDTDKNKNIDLVSGDRGSSPTNGNTNNDKSSSSRNKKRSRPTFGDGYEWARKRMKMSDALAPFIHRISDKISDGVEFKFEYFQFITSEASKGGKIGSGPSGVSGVCFIHVCAVNIICLLISNSEIIVHT